MFEFTQYQRYTFNNIVNNRKSMLFWSRQTGKSLILNKLIEDFSIKNKNRNILFIVDVRSNINLFKMLFRRDIDSIIVSESGETVNLINGNKVYFFPLCDNLNSFITGCDPYFIIYEGSYFYNILNLTGINEIIYYINIININCKFLFIGGLFEHVIESFDINNDFYINILPKSSKLSEFRQYDVDQLRIEDEDLNDELLIYFKYKPDFLFDYGSLKFQRICKMRRLQNLQ